MSNEKESLKKRLSFFAKCYQNYCMHIILMALFLILSSCSVYRSPDRKDFESDNPKFTATNLVFQNCAHSSIGLYASSSKFIKLDENFDHQQIALWEHIVNNESVFETDNFERQYCVYKAD